MFHHQQQQRFQEPDPDSIEKKINLDDLFEKKKQKNLQTLATFNKILNRIHTRIHKTSLQSAHDEWIWFQVPQFMIGAPKYDMAECIAYLIDKLNGNGFAVKYFTPYTLFICWKDWVPAYVRDEIREKLNVVVDGHGNVVKREGEDDDGGQQIVDEYDRSIGGGGNKGLSTKQINVGSSSSSSSSSSKKSNKIFKPTENYKPTGAFLYDDILFQNIQKKLG